MNIRNIYLIYCKELLEAFRYPRAIMAMVLIPLVIYPLLFFGVNQLTYTQRSKMKAKTADIVIVGDEKLADKLLTDNEDFNIKSIANPQEALEQNEIQAILEIPLRLIEEADTNIAVIIQFDGTEEFSAQTKGKLTKELENAQLEIAKDRLKRRGLIEDPTALLTEHYNNIASEEQMSGFIMSKIIPFILVFMLLTGGSGTAISLIAGEKEKGTIETLLVSGVKRESIVIGKYLIVLTTSLIAASLNLLSIFVTFSLGIFKLPTATEFIISPNAIILIFLLMIPLALIFSALLMIVASYANTVKEGQNYIMPLVFMCFLPALLAAMPDIKLNIFYALIPVSNIALALRDILIGDCSLGMLIIVLVSSILQAGILIIFTSNLLKKESIILGRGSEPILMYGLRTPRNWSRVIFIFFAIEILILYFLGSIFQGWSIVGGLLLTQWGLILIPVIMFLYIFKLQPEEALNYKKSSLQFYIGAILLGLSTWGLASLLYQLQDLVIPAPREFLKGFVFLEISGKDPIMLSVMFFTVAISPGICEEIMFRGIILSRLKKNLSRFHLILIVSLLFGFFHLNVYRLLTTTFIGLVLTYITLASDSIFPAMIIHILNNAVAVFLSNFVGEVSLFVTLMCIPVFCLGIIVIYLAEKKKEGVISQKSLVID